MFLRFQTTHSFRMLSLIPTHSSTIHESCQTYISCSIIYIYIITQSYPIKTDHTGTSKVQNHSAASPSISPRLRGLAQAGCLAQASLPSPRREGKNKCVAITGSRLSEIPLAWASGLLAQKVSESPGRDLVQRSPCFISPRRDWLAWARLAGLATVLHWNSHENQPNHTCKALPHLQTTDPTVQTTNNS